jgi:hypothetical protein
VSGSLARTSADCAAATTSIRGVPRLGLGQQPQMSFRALAVHVPSVLPVAAHKQLAI